MSPETSNTSGTKVCPTCGTRLAENATRCLVCGTELSLSVEMKKPHDIQANRMPEITLSLPAALGLLALFLIVGAALVFVILRVSGGELGAQEAGPSPTITMTLTITPTETEQATNTPVPTPTVQPPFDYTVAGGDSCSGIAAVFGVSVRSIMILNNLSSACTLSVGQKLKVPYPTPTQALLPTATLDPISEVLRDCETAIYIVQENDTLSSIAANYGVPQDEIKNFNGLASNNVFLGAPLTIPLCKRAATPGPSPTPTIPPPYTAPNLLLPADGASFSLINETIALQWASVGTLRDNEAYMVVIEDVTDGQGRRLIDYVTDTKFIIPTSFRPKDSVAHIFRWWVSTARQSGGADDQGQPIWVSAGAQSIQRVFNWQGTAPEATPTP
jgi:LysM repeat protein